MSQLYPNSIETLGTEWARLPDFGFFHMTVSEAAENLAVHLWYLGEYPEIEEPKDFQGDPFVSCVFEALAGKRKDLQNSLIRSITTGILKADLIQRNLADDIDPEHTYIFVETVENWMIDRGFGLQSDVFAEWLNERRDRFRNVIPEVDFHRNATNEERQKLGTTYSFNEDDNQRSETDSSHADLKAAYKVAITNIRELEREIARDPTATSLRLDRPLPSRQRRTLLTIIAALCDYSGIDPNAREAAGQIASLTDEIGASVTAETIRTLLKEIPQALETRKK